MASLPRTRLPDLMASGCRNMVVSPKEVKAYVGHQPGALMAFAAAEVSGSSTASPTRALYNMVVKT